MADSDDFGDEMHRHFLEISKEGFEENLRKYCPDVPTGEHAGQLARYEGGMEMSEVYELQPKSVTLPLDAYLASALTGLAQEERTEIFEVSGIIGRACKELGINLYEPRKHTDPVAHSEVEDAEVFRIDRERVLTSDLLILLTHHPSFGAGQELDFACTALVPIMIVSRSQERVSRMVTGIPALKVRVEYRTPEDLDQEMRRTLVDMRPLLVERKLAFSKRHDARIVGERVRILRNQLGLTRDEVVQNAPHMTPELLGQIEESTDRTSNPSLVQLRELATVLKTTVTDLVEPDFGGRMKAHLEDWVEGRAAARFGLSPQDRDRLVRRVLRRVIDSFDRE